MKICSDTVGNPSRDLPACSAVPQPTARPRKTEGHLTNIDVHSCTDVISPILVLYLRAEQVTLTCFDRFLIQIF
jgi:hypothetical protein